jgi:hypothetical protein
MKLLNFFAGFLAGVTAVAASPAAEPNTDIQSRGYNYGVSDPSITTDQISLLIM